MMIEFSLSEITALKLGQELAIRSGDVDYRIKREADDLFMIVALIESPSSCESGQDRRYSGDLGLG